MAKAPRAPQPEGVELCPDTDGQHKQGVSQHEHLTLEPHTHETCMPEAARLKPHAHMPGAITTPFHKSCSIAQCPRPGRKPDTATKNRATADGLTVTCLPRACSRKAPEVTRVVIPLLSWFLRPWPHDAPQSSMRWLRAPQQQPSLR